MEVVFGFVVFLAGLFFGGVGVIAVFAKAGINKENLDWLVRIENAKRGDITTADVDLLVGQMETAYRANDRSRRHHA